MGNKSVNNGCALSKTNKKAKKATAMTTDDRASMIPHAVTVDAVSETVIELDEEVVAKFSPVVAVTQDCDVWCQFSLPFLFSNTELDAHSGHPHQKDSKVIKELLD